MSKKTFTAMAVAFVLAALPLFSHAQSNDGNAPLGSKGNPIKPSSSNAVSPNGNSSSKGKRGSKNNPIAGSTHPRGTSAN